MMELLKKIVLSQFALGSFVLYAIYKGLESFWQQLTQYLFGLFDQLVAIGQSFGIDTVYLQQQFGELGRKMDGLFAFVAELNAIVPVVAISGIVGTGLATIVTIRIIRWVLGAIPTLNLG